MLVDRRYSDYHKQLEDKGMITKTNTGGLGILSSGVSGWLVEPVSTTFLLKLTVKTMLPLPTAGVSAQQGKGGSKEGRRGGGGHICVATKAITAALPCCFL